MRLDKVVDKVWRARWRATHSPNAILQQITSAPLPMTRRRIVLQQAFWLGTVDLVR